MLELLKQIAIFTVLVTLPIAVINYFIIMEFNY